MRQIAQDGRLPTFDPSVDIVSNNSIISRGPKSGARCGAAPSLLLGYYLCRSICLLPANLPY